MVLVVSAFYFSFSDIACAIFLQLKVVLIKDMSPYLYDKLSIQKWSYEITWERNIFQQCFHCRVAAALNLFYESKVTFQCVNIKPTQSASECVNPCHLAYQILARNISRNKTKLQFCARWQYIYAHLAKLIQYISLTGKDDEIWSWKHSHLWATVFSQVSLD